MPNAPTLIIIPTYNEKENIDELLKRLFALYPTIDVLVVDDHSPDGTQDLVRDRQKEYGERLILIGREGKNGRGSAVLEGFSFALQHGYQQVIEMDADFSHQPEDIRLFLDTIRTCDFVTGSRHLAGSVMHQRGLGRRIISVLANTYARLVLGIPLTDYSNGFRCYSRRALESLRPEDIQSKGYVVLSETAYQLYRNNMRIGEVPVTFYDRARGTSNFGLHEILEGFVAILRIRFRPRGK
ncbi:MAG: polyprenol monophosphomannose synthase [Candidatus Peregrinibacteria bacterium]